MKIFKENSAVARLREDILRVWGPGDPPNILKRESWIHKTENSVQLITKLRIGLSYVHIMDGWGGGEKFRKLNRALYRVMNQEKLEH